MKKPAASIRLIPTLATLLFGFLLAQPGRTEVTITFGGDFSLGRDGAKPDAAGTLIGRRLVSWQEITAGLRPLWADADINFANLETVVSAREVLPRSFKKYAFQTHPEGIRQAVRAGLNLFSTANNHLYDFKEDGLLDTLTHLDALSRSHGIAHAGSGLNLAEAANPVIFTKNGIRIAFAAIGITTQPGQRATPDHPGNIDFRHPGHYDLILKNLAAAEADYRILSIHCGKEGSVDIDPGQVAQFRRAVDLGRADLVLGHHPHVVRPAELYQGALIFYSLGNYLITGARALNSESIEKSFGLLGRIHIGRDRDDIVRARSVELFPLTDMSRVSRVSPPGLATKQLAALNRLAMRSFGKSGTPVLVDIHPGRSSGALCLSDEPGERSSMHCAVRGAGGAGQN